jgi:hypothetical protein
MRDVDPSAKIVDLRVEVDRLQSELDSLPVRSRGATGGSHRGTIVPHLKIRSGRSRS